jgi:hypothetical protein
MAGDSRHRNVKAESDRNTTHGPAFQAEDLDQVADYRAMSGLALVSLLFGLASPLCFTAPVFLSIPLFGTAISLVALRRIAASDGGLAGQWAAAVGLALCMVSAAAATSHAQVTRYLRTQQAQQLGYEWLHLLVSDKLPDAYQLTVDSTRPEPPEPPVNMPGSSPPEPPFDRFVKNPLVEQLTSAGTEADIRLVQTLAYEPQPRRQCIVQQHFRVVPSSTEATGIPSAATTIEALLTFQCSQLPGESRLHWLVLGYRLQDDQLASAQD